jgi:hypothetical protein
MVKRALFLIAAMLFASWPAQAQQQTIRTEGIVIVEGLSGVFASLAPDSSSGEDYALVSPTNARVPLGARESVVFNVHGQDHTFEGVPLAALLAAVDAPLGAALRGEALAATVEVRARWLSRHVFAGRN